MPTSRAWSAAYPPSLPSQQAFDAARLQRVLPAVLSVVAGTVDVIGFVTLKLFTAHVTGNLVVISAFLVDGGSPNMTQILAVPVFMVAVAVVWLIAKQCDRQGAALARPLLLIQFLLLTGVLIFSVVYDPSANPRGLPAGIAAMIAVSAMACQFALLRLALPSAPSTAVMTGNLTNAVLSMLDTVSRSDADGSKAKLRRTLELLVGFCAGCMAGAAAVSWMGKWAWLLPVVLAGAALLTAPRRQSSTA